MYCARSASKAVWLRSRHLAVGAADAAAGASTVCSDLRADGVCSGFAAAHVPSCVPAVVTIYRTLMHTCNVRVIVLLIGL